MKILNKKIQKNKKDKKNSNPNIPKKKNELNKKNLLFNSYHSNSTMTSNSHGWSPTSNSR